MKINIKHVAEKSGFSTATVSRVLRNYPGVREQTRKKVLEAVSELDYEVNAIARSLRQKKTYSIGIIVGNVLSQFYSVIAKSVEDTANKFGYNTILCNGDENPEKELNYLKVLKSNRVDGIILTPTGKNSEYINNLISSGNKVVLLDRVIEGVDCDAVLVDNANGAYKAVKYLIDQGYKRIGIINGYLDRTTGAERLKGYLQALAEANIAKDKSLIKIGNFKKESGKKLTKELLKQVNKPEAIFVTNIDMSMGALSAIKEMGVSIPDEIGLICFDDSEWAPLINPPITVIRQPVYQLGSTASELLIRNIENNEKDLIHKSKIIILQTELIIRNSTKKLIN
ncbi:MAG: LacI family DNA-binding transcriptional regulator [Atribacterota bacterium]|nr:LacI family DNA-binding transcriptional regulator [Atribacterota bacterium]MDD5497189.1 LacI family DNA-binding transcriptional regulator [Atribacterota bacterium]